MSPLGRHDPGHHHHRGFARAIREAPRKGRKSLHGRRVDDRTTTADKHVTGGFARAQENAGKVEADPFLPGSKIKLNRVGRTVDAAVMAEDVNPPEGSAPPSANRRAATPGAD